MDSFWWSMSLVCLEALENESRRASSIELSMFFCKRLLKSAI